MRITCCGFLLPRFTRLRQVLWLYGLAHRQFVFIAYAALYGYVGVSSILIRDMSDATAVLSYFVVTGIAMLVTLIVVARRFGRES